MSTVPERVGALSPEKLALLVLRLQRRGKTRAANRLMRRSPGAGLLPLSFAQERLWFVDQLQPGSPAYNISSALPFTGPLNTKALARSLSELVRRHEVLRTTFAVVNNSPVQVINPPTELSLPLVDLRPLPAAERLAEFQRLSAQEAEHLFSLAMGPLIRGVLVRLADDHHVLLLTTHHIISDGWSMGILQRELGILYEAFSRGLPSSLPELPIQYADYALWQRERLKTEGLEQQLAFWREQLSGAPPLSGLPTDRPRPAVQSPAGAWLTLHVPREVTSQLHALGQQQGATLFMTLLSAFGLVLRHHAGQDDLVIGTPIANRNHAEIEGLMGFFVNALPLRLRFSRDSSFRELVAQVREVTLAAYSHQDLPFEKLVEELRPERNPAHHPLFQVTFAFQNLPTLEGPRQNGLSAGMDAAHASDVAQGMVKFDLSLHMREEPDGLVGALGYSTTLFEEATIRRWVEGFLRLLREVAREPERRLADCSFVTEAERRTLLEWAGPAAPMASHPPVHLQISAWAAQAAPSLAVVSDAERITYADLDRRATALASRLIEQGAGPEVPVGLCLPDSVEFVVGALAILKSGSACVPIDPAEHESRIRHILEDAGIHRVVSSPRIWERNASPDVTLVNVLERGPGSNQAPSRGAEVHPDQLAFILYPAARSAPWGVELRHGTLADMLAAVRQLARLGPDEVLLPAALPLESHLAALLLSLSAGASVLVGSRGPSEPQTLLDRMNWDEATALLAPAEVVRGLCAIGWPDTSAPKILLAHDSALPEETARRLLEVGSSVWALHGEPETGIWSLGGTAQAGNPRAGPPLAGARRYVLDEALTPVAIGAVGTLCIAGSGLARGYWRRPAESAERLTPDALARIPGDRLFRTGQRARYRPDGTLELLMEALATAAPPSEPSDREIVPPRTTVEELLHGIWTEVLRRGPLSIHDNFFELGGHSLLATQIVSRIREVFRTEVPLRRLFEASTIAELAAVLAEQPATRELAGTSDSKPEEGQIPRRPDAGPVPLSFAQERLWFLDQFQPGLPLYNMPTAIAFRGMVDPRAVERSLEALIERHEALRTTFASVEDRPVQVIALPPRLRLPVTDLRHLPATRSHAEFQRLAAQEANAMFDLKAGPLVRARLVHMADDSHVLLLTLHHIVSDGWSMVILRRELEALYQAVRVGETPALPPLPIQYADYAVWQRERLRGEPLEQLLEYWRTQLAHLPKLLALPTDRPRPSEQTTEGASQSFVLPAELVQRLEALSHQEGATPFMTLLAGFALLLYRYSGQSDIALGSPIANRSRTELENLIGFFVNTLVLRLRLSPELTFRELLRQAYEVTLGAYAHQELPFERIVEELQPIRDVGHNPLFQVMFALQNVPDRPGQVGGPPLEGSTEPVSCVARFDLSVFMASIEGGRMLGVVEYNTRLFDAARITRLMGHFRTLLEALVAAPDTRLGRLPLLTEAERHELLVRWNETREDFAPPRCVHELFEAQARRTPDAPAVTSRQGSLSYGELDRRANALARRLRAQGIRAESRVGLCVDRTVESMIGVLGILKAGSAYVPIDPAYPAHRIAFMLSDARVSALVATGSALEQLPPVEAPIVRLDDAQAPAGAALEHEVAPDNLAYVIYTSGSTGTPKGVAMPHRPLFNLVAWQLRQSRMGPGSRTLQFAPLSFDVSFQEMFSTWGSGGTLVLIEEDSRRDALQLLEHLRAQEIHRLFVPPLMLRELASVAGGEALPLQEVVTAGEALQITPAVARLFASQPGCRLINQYGPSETHVATASPLEGPPSSWPALPSIGRPIGNARIYLLDETLEPVPIGIPGALYIGGEAIARGYLDRPSLTAERFIPDPFSGSQGARLYRTGDVARFLPDGALEFLGRNDDQVKLRGFRIELGEVETALKAHPAVKESAAVVRRSPAGDPRLIAYVESEPEAVSSGELRRFLRERLPDYMVPSLIEVMTPLPRSPNGKLDRRALPEPQTDRATLDREYTAPRSMTEQALAHLWAEVLGLTRVGIHDNFFDLGGHSLLATRLSSRIKSHFEVDPRVRDIFDAPTIAELAVRIEELRSTASRSPCPSPARFLSLEQVEQLSDAEVDELLRSLHGGPLP